MDLINKVCDLCHLIKLSVFFWYTDSCVEISTDKMFYIYICTHRAENENNKKMHVCMLHFDHFTLHMLSCFILYDTQLGWLTSWMVRHLYYFILNRFPGSQNSPSRKIRKSWQSYIFDIITADDLVMLRAKVSADIALYWCSLQGIFIP